jgi:hypothetical protein
MKKLLMVSVILNIALAAVLLWFGFSPAPEAPQSFVYMSSYNVTYENLTQEIVNHVDLNWEVVAVTAHRTSSNINDCRFVVVFRTTGD